jgi:prepilin-type N-terminal cleavage/methylation domain-containing protein
MRANCRVQRGGWEAGGRTARAAGANRDPGKCPASETCAFTLLELLLVIAVIGILASLLLPSLNRAKGSAQGAQCASNIRQLIQGWLMYADDNNGQLPCNSDGQDGMGVFTNWVAGTMSRTTDATNTLLLIDAQHSSMARYIASPGVYKCPGDKSRFVRSMSMNCRLNPTRIKGTPAFAAGGNSRYATFRRVQEIGRPDAIFVILDERSDSINDGYFGVDMSNTGTRDGGGASNPYWMIDYPASYHGGSGRVSFADSHVETHRWLEPTTLVPLGRAHPGSHTSATDRDVRWLQDHCTVLNSTN